jgi:PKD repeat protein
VWDFGDGMRDETSGMGVGHSYAAPGAYNLTLTITDQNGQTGSTSIVVQIDPAPAPEPQSAPAPQEPPPPEPAPQAEPAPQVEPPPPEEPAPAEQAPAPEEQAPAPEEAPPADAPAPEGGEGGGGG